MILLEEGWEIIMEFGIKKVILGLPEPHFTSSEVMNLYTVVHIMCTQKPPHEYSSQLYERYRESLMNYLVLGVLPSLREVDHMGNQEFLLREFFSRWVNHKVMVKWMSHFFRYLDRYFVERNNVPSLVALGDICFYDVVYKEMNGRVRDAVISLIDREREGERIDRDLVKNVVGIFVEMGMGQYENDFEVAMLNGTTAYYSSKAAKWVREDSHSEYSYMLKAEECLRQEKERVSNYLHQTSEVKLLERVKHELLVVCANHLREKEHFDCNMMQKKLQEMTL